MHNSNQTTRTILARIEGLISSSSVEVLFHMNSYNSQDGTFVYSWVFAMPHHGTDENGIPLDESALLSFQEHCFEHFKNGLDTILGASLDYRYSPNLDTHPIKAFVSWDTTAFLQITDCTIILTLNSYNY